ncbi:restriction endonuclease subunit S, partial [Paenarthrobacter sp. RAF9]
SRAGRAGSKYLRAADHYVNDDALPALKGTLVPPGSTLFAKIGEAIRHEHRVISARPMLIDNNAMAACPRSGVDAEYLFRFLQTQRFYALASSTTVPSIRKSVLAEVLVPLPPLEEQRRIAAILDKADELRAKRRQAIAHLDALTQSTFHSMFSEITSHAAFGSLCPDGLRNGVSPSTRGTVEQRVLTLSAVTGSSFDANSVKTSRFDRPISDNNRVSTRLFLICRGNGNRSLVGKACFPRFDIPDVGFPDTVIAAEPDFDVINPFFLEAAWSLPNVRAQIEAAAKTTNGTFKINQASLSAIQLPVPPLELQQTFATRVAAVERLKETHRKHLAELDALFASLQSRAFKGEL